MKEEPKVRCRHDALVNAQELRPNPDNPNTHSSKQIKLYSKIIEATGWRKPVVVSNQSGMITCGHGRHQAALLKGWHVPVEYQDYDNEAQEYADLVADNHLAELAQIDKKKLKSLFERKILSQSDFDTDTTSYMKDEIDKMFENMQGGDDGEFPITAQLNEKYDYVVVMTSNETDSQFLRTLLRIGKQKSYKNQSVGYARCLRFEDFMEALRANLDSIDVKG